MARYSAITFEIYDDDPAPSGLHRIGGMPIGLATADWPRWQGRPMQHAFTIDLAELELNVPRAAEARALAVFVDSHYELDVESSEGITVVWLTQAEIDANGETTPPEDFEPEQPNRWQMDDEGKLYEPGELVLEIERVDDEDNAGQFGHSYIGGQPNWGDQGEPEQLPEGAFVMQVMGESFPLCRIYACLFVFEGGAYLRAEYPDDRRPVPWPEAIARSRELILLDQPPPADALQKWGGLPRGVDEYAWPPGLSHVMTWVPDQPEEPDVVAYALFGRLSKRDNWDDQASFYQVVEIRSANLEKEVELPEGVELLAERTIELRELPEGCTWRDLQTRSFIGPRPAWRRPDRRSAEAISEGSVLQLNDELLPVSPGRGSLHACTQGHSSVIWHPAYGAPQATRELHGPRGTLYAEDTSAAIVVGWHFSFREYSILPERMEALEQTLQGALATRGLELRLFVPGDTTSDRNAEIRGGFVLGRAVVVVEANDYEPGPVDLQEIANELAGLPALDDAFWREALAFFDIEPPAEPRAYLLSWGPLCYGGVHAGVVADDDEEPVYEFVANQNMEQIWSSCGVDGVHVQSVEFTDIAELEASEASLEAVDQLDDPGLWLLCRYD